jgi:tetratricopeptide (TPR) repeat protein
VFSGSANTELVAADRAAQIARVVGDAEILAWAENTRGTALILAGRDEEAVPAITMAAQLAEAQGDDECLAEALDSLAWICEERGEFERSRDYAKGAMLAAERLGNPARIAAEMGRLGDYAFYMGEWEQARRCYEQAQVIDQEIGLAPTSCSLAGLLFQLGRLYMAQGAWETGSHYLEQSSSIYAPQGKRAGLRQVQSLLAERELLEGHPAVARARLLPLLDRWDVEEHHVTTHVLPWLAWAHLDLGDTEHAARVVADAIRRARAQHYQLALVAALRVQAIVASRQGRWAEAVAVLEEGLALTRSLSYPYAEGRLLHLYGATHVQKGEPEPARAWLEAALAIFQRLGARKDLEWTAQLLSVLG